MKYKNPIIISDYSDPDVIRYKNNFYLISSSFNYIPGIPILKSSNLVNWKIINYIIPKALPFKEHDAVLLGKGVWAPSLRYHEGYFYALIPLPDKGIYMSRTKNIEGEWEELHLLYEGKGFIDPCPIWTKDNECYVVFAFAKSRIGFNSRIALIKVTSDLRLTISQEYKVIYNGGNVHPTIEGPKIYYLNDYFYILAPAGGVTYGYQVCLRSKNICGPYEDKIVLSQGQTKVNGPHQGALLSLSEGRYVFFHFQDKGAYGRIIHLQKVTWIENWPLIGDINTTPPSPLNENEYFINKKARNKFYATDMFKGKLNKSWQFPSNIKENYISLDKKQGIYLTCYYHPFPLHLYQRLLTQKPIYFNFTCIINGELNFLNEEDEFGVSIMGTSYTYLSFKKEKQKTIYRIVEYDKNEKEIYKTDYDQKEFNLKLKVFKKDDEMHYKYAVLDKYLPYEFVATPGDWVGARITLFARNKENDNINFGKIKIKYFKTRKNKGEE